MVGKSRTLSAMKYIEDSTSLTAILNQEPRTVFSTLNSVMAKEEMVAFGLTLDKAIIMFKEDNEEYEDFEWERSIIVKYAKDGFYVIFSDEEGKEIYETLFKQGYMKQAFEDLWEKFVKNYEQLAKEKKVNNTIRTSFLTISANRGFKRLLNSIIKKKKKEASAQVLTLLGKYTPSLNFADNVYPVLISSRSNNSQLSADYLKFLLIGAQYSIIYVESFGQDEVQNGIVYVAPIDFSMNFVQRMQKVPGIIRTKGDALSVGILSGVLSLLESSKETDEGRVEIGIKEINTRASFTVAVLSGTTQIKAMNLVEFSPHEGMVTLLLPVLNHLKKQFYSGYIITGNEGLPYLRALASTLSGSASLFEFLMEHHDAYLKFRGAYKSDSKKALSEYGWLYKGQPLNIEVFNFYLKSLMEGGVVMEDEKLKEKILSSARRVGRDYLSIVAGMLPNTVNLYRKDIIAKLHKVRSYKYLVSVLNEALLYEGYILNSIKHAEPQNLKMDYSTIDADVETIREALTNAVLRGKGSMSHFFNDEIRDALESNPGLVGEVTSILVGLALSSKPYLGLKKKKELNGGVGDGS